ncbi:DUF58 domain-containing protein [Pseudoalteromonas sp. MMG005]|uniref:DUF58 domain-containing protein n=1 Tax=Pseudoalteromonas sp. MMG005 TaxID=2822682 RepID=UPI001B3A4571|nr:DUF58 domain-containing protein [Pseudoalteromonas sp. MMG005]MBQ4848415.1 DUF58 domain-containing protein [Pseudoalteromonas sp. MMG005]
MPPLFQNLLDKILSKKHQCESIVFKHDSIYVVPSKGGFGFLSIALLNFILGINYQNNLILAVSYIMVILLVVSLIYGYLNFKGLGLRLIHAQADHAGGKTDAVFELITDKNRFDISIHHIKTGAITICDFLSQTSITKSNLKLPRGVHLIGKFKVFSHYPFGLVRVWSYLISQQKLYVYPAPLNANTDMSSIETNNGAKQNLLVADSNDEFKELINYQKGMSLHQVSWRHYAKNQEMLVKNYVGEQRASVGFDFNLLTGTVEERLSKLCFLVLQATENQQPFAMKLPNRVLDSGSGRQHCQVSLEILSEH